MIGIVDLSGKKGTGIHGIIEEYVAKGNISTGGFVKYIGELIKDKELISTNDNESIAEIISVAQLDENTVFIVHNNGSNTVKYYVYGVVCKIQNGEIIVGTDTQLTSEYIKGISIVALNKNKVLIAYSPAESSYLRARICTINEMDIEVGDMSYLATDTGFEASVISATKLTESKVFVAYSNSIINKYLYGVVCTIDGDAITHGTNIQLSSIKDSGKIISVTTLSQNAVFITHSYSSNSDVYGMICTVEDMTITKGTDTKLGINKTGTIATALNNNKLIVAYGCGTASIKILVCATNQSSITIEKNKEIECGNGLYPRKRIVTKFNKC